MWIVNGQIINRQKDFTDGNGARQRGVILVKWSVSALAAIGVQPFREDPIPKGYKSTGYTDAVDANGTVVRTHTTVAIDTLAQAKLNRIDEMNKAAYQLLQPTDYYITRNAEKGTAIPATVTTERDQIRADILTNQNAINALTTYDEVIAYAITWTPTV